MLIVDKENASAVRVQLKIAHRRPEELGDDNQAQWMLADRDE